MPSQVFISSHWKDDYKLMTKYAEEIKILLAGAQSRKPFNGRFLLLMGLLVTMRVLAVHAKPKCDSYLWTVSPKSKRKLVI